MDVWVPSNAVILCFCLFLSHLSDISALKDSSNGTACQNLGTADLTRKMHESGKFNELYMAATLDDAAKNFPDLTDRRFYRSSQRYVCDQSCQDKTENVKRLLNGKGQQVDWPRVNSPTTPSPGIRAPPVAANAGGRKKREDNKSLKLENVGQSYVLYCSPEGFEEQQGYRRLCAGCRSVRELPDDYFPRFLNEVRCQGTQCVKDHGHCVQKFINFDILRNEGSKDCQRWVPYTVNVPVCCDCLLSSQSTIFLTMVQKE